MIFKFQHMEILLIFQHSTKVFDLGRGTPIMVIGHWPRIFSPTSSRRKPVDLRSSGNDDDKILPIPRKPQQQNDGR